MNGLPKDKDLAEMLIPITNIASKICIIPDIAVILDAAKYILLILMVILRNDLDTRYTKMNNLIISKIRFIALDNKKLLERLTNCCPDSISAVFPKIK
jgi:hypothetical protein